MNKTIEQAYSQLETAGTQVCDAVEETIKSKASSFIRNFLLLSEEGIQLVGEIVRTMKVFAIGEHSSYQNIRTEEHSSRVCGHIECSSPRRRSEIIGFGDELFRFLREELGCNTLSFREDTSTDAVLDQLCNIVYVFTFELIPL